MAVNVKINNVTYSGVPSVQIPLADATGNATFWETGESNATASDILYGKTAYNANGLVTGSATVPAVSQDSVSHVLSIV